MGIHISVTMTSTALLHSRVHSSEGPVIPRSQRHGDIYRCTQNRHIPSNLLQAPPLFTNHTQDSSTNYSWNLALILWGAIPLYGIMPVRTLGSFVGPGEQLPLQYWALCDTLWEQDNNFMTFRKALELPKQVTPPKGDLWSHDIWRHPGHKWEPS